MKSMFKISILTLIILAIIAGMSHQSLLAVIANASSINAKDIYLPVQADLLDEVYSDQQMFNLYIPMFYNEEGLYTSSLLINNLENSSATIVISGYTDTGQTFSLVDIIPANGSATYAQHPDIPSGFTGSIVISSDRQLTAKSTISDSGFRAFATYVGRERGSLNLFLPLLPYASTDETTLFSLQNIGSSTADVTISYSHGMSLSATIQPNAPAFFDVELEGIDSTAVTANITSDQPLVAAVLIPKNRETFSAYTGLHDGTTTPFFPMLQREDEEGHTEIWLQNIGDQMTEITLEYIPILNGESCEETIPIVPNNIGFLTLMRGPCVSENFLGSTRVKTNSTNQPLVGLARQLLAAGSRDIYNAFDVNEAMNGIFLPLIMDRNNGWNTTIALQHIGGPSASVTCHFFDTAYEIRADLEIGASLIDSQKYQVRDSYEGSAFCLADNDETKIAAVVSQLGASDVMIYESTAVDISSPPSEYDCSNTICKAVEPVKPTNVTINGPISGIISTTYTFAAQVTPDNVTQPFTNTWQAEGQALINQAGGGIDAVAYTWDEPGTYTITLNTSNLGGSVSAVHEITITNAQTAPTCADITEISQIECQALQALYDNTDGPNWVNTTAWFETTTPCSWSGIGCSSEQPRNIESLELRSSRLNGSIPSELGDLTNLRLLSIEGNQLSGEIPAALGNLPNLHELNIGGNQLSGPIPMSFISSNIKVFDYYIQDGLCEPDDPDFRSWLAGVDTEFLNEDDIELCSSDPLLIESIEVEIAGNSGPARDLDDGTVIIAFPRLFVADFSIKLNATCADGTAPTAPFLDMVTNNTTASLPMPVFEASTNTYLVSVARFEIPSNNSTLNVRAVCSSAEESVRIGAIRLYDPIGRVTDAITGEPITGASVTLYHVPGWSPRTGPADNRPNTCESNLSKDANARWSQPAPIGQGVVINRESTLISPPTSSKSTDNNGAYGWDISQGCWYVRVTADEYEPITSAVVGVPPAVTDLDLALRPLSALQQVYLPVISR